MGVAEEEALERAGHRSARQPFYDRTIARIGVRKLRLVPCSSNAMSVRYRSREGARAFLEHPPLKRAVRARGKHRS